MELYLYKKSSVKGEIMRKMKLAGMILLTLLTSQAFALFETNETKALLENEKNTISIFKDNAMSVVHVSNIKKIKRGFFYDLNPMEVVEGEGTGFIWSDEGFVVTNFHVVQGGSKFMVKLHQDEKEYEAKLVGTEPTKDIAVLKLINPPKKIKAVKVGDSKNLEVGQKAVAIGNPFGLDNTLTQGIVSALGRSITGIGGVKIYDMIQTDTSINPGNSGGPLLNSSGEVIGVNTMIFSNSGSSAGVGFAVPINTVKAIVPQIIKYGEVKRAGLGIRHISRDILYRRFGIKVEKGLPIGFIFKGSAAEKAGLQGMTQDEQKIYVGDVILEIDGKEIDDFDDIFNVLFEYKIGDKVEVKYEREGKVKTTSVQLENLRAR